MNILKRVCFGRIFEWVIGAIVALAVLLMPVTSMPFLSRIAGGTLVAPPSVVLLALAAVIWLPVHILRKDFMPREVLPLLVFTLVAVIACLASYFIALPPYKDFSYTREMVSAVVTLAAGVITYVLISTWFSRSSRLVWAFRLINISGVLVMLWSVAQIVIIYFFDGQYPPLMESIHNFFSVRLLGTLTFTKRVTGFALEPSWLANQLNVFFLPFWTAATITGYTAFKKRVLKISLENLLLVVGILTMLMSLSRIGLLTLLLVFSFLLLRLTTYLVQRGKASLEQTKLADRLPWLKSRGVLGLLLGLGLFTLFALMAFGLIYGLSYVDPRLARMLNLKVLPENFFSLAHKLAFAERLSYWTIGWDVFSRYPFLGVGLGNSGFFFLKSLPLDAGILNEILGMKTVWVLLPHPKNLWIRMLAETGVVGFSVFISWLYVLWRSGKFLLSSADRLERACGWMGLITILALIGEGFSVDSFALPYFWASLGIVTAASLVARRRVSETNSIT